MMTMMSTMADVYIPVAMPVAILSVALNVSDFTVVVAGETSTVE